MLSRPPFRCVISTLVPMCYLDPCSDVLSRPLFRCVISTLVPMCYLDPCSDVLYANISPSAENACRTLAPRGERIIQPPEIDISIQEKPHVAPLISHIVQMHSSSRCDTTRRSEVAITCWRNRRRDKTTPVFHYPPFSRSPTVWFSGKLSYFINMLTRVNLSTECNL